MTGPGVGILTAVIVDVALPLTIGLLLVWRLRRSGKRYWIGAGIYLGVVALTVWGGISDVFRYEGAGVVGATITALPTSLIPAIFNSLVIENFFTDPEWAHGGYQVVLTIYVAGLLAWALLNAALLRAAIVGGQTWYGHAEAAAKARDEARGPDDMSILRGDNA